MSRIRNVVIAVTLLATAALAQTVPAQAELTSLLREFLHAAEVGDRAVFDRFFADDAISLPEHRHVHAPAVRGRFGKEMLARDRMAGNAHP